LGAHDPDEAALLVNGGITHGVLAMDNFAWGVQPAHATQSVAAAEMTA
jgi:hypothetical protein